MTVGDVRAANGKFDHADCPLIYALQRAGIKAYSVFFDVFTVKEKPTDFTLVPHSFEPKYDWSDFVFDNNSITDYLPDNLILRTFKILN